MEKTRGFITVATGSEEYFRLARNLLRSYRHFCGEQLPFALLTDRENEYTAEFDDVILFRDGASNSYLDKLCLAEYMPYDITVFIDADCLAFGDLNVLFDYFAEADDFSCFGRVLPLEDKTGWFEYENLGDLREKVSYVVGLHGGIYYMRKGEAARKIFADAKAFVPDYPKFRFKGKFTNPGDEPLVALSMAVNGCHPIPFVDGAIQCYWEHVGDMTLDITRGLARVNRTGCNTVLLHWGTRYTRSLEYREQLELLEIMEAARPDREQCIRKCRKHYSRLKAAERCRAFVTRVKNKLKRMAGMK